MPPYSEEDRRYPLSLETRIVQMETDLRYLKPDIERRFRDQREYFDAKFAELQTVIQRGNFTQPRQIILILAGVIGGGLVFLVALWIAVGGLT